MTHNNFISTVLEKIPNHWTVLLCALEYSVKRCFMRFTKLSFYSKTRYLRITVLSRSSKLKKDHVLCHRISLYLVGKNARYRTYWFVLYTSWKHILNLVEFNLHDRIPLVGKGELYSFCMTYKPYKLT